MDYTCQNCGVKVNNSSSLCNPIDVIQDNLCGISIDHFWVSSNTTFDHKSACQDKLSAMKYSCSACGRQSADENLSCDPEQSHSDDPVGSEKLFRQFFQQHSAIMLLVDPVSCRILDANNAAVRFYGYSRDEFRAMTIQQVNMLPPKEIFEILKKIQDQTQNHFIVPHRLANGTIRTVEVYSTPIQFHDKPFNFAIIHDITERNYAEEALKKSEERFSLAMEATMDGLWDWDIASGDVYYSPGYWLMLGYDAASVKPSSVEAWGELIHPDDKEAVYAANYDCIENRSETFLVEFRMWTRDGHLNGFKAVAKL